MTLADITPEMCLLAMEGCEPTESVEYARRFIEATRIVPDWFLEHFNNALVGKFKFGITHRGEHFERWAVSADDAKNKLRFSIYGTVAEADLMPFDVVQFFPSIGETVEAYKKNMERLNKSTTPRRKNVLSYDAMREKFSKLIQK